MKNLPANLVLEKNKLDDQDAWLILLDITMPNNDEYYLVRNNEDIVWNNYLYTAVAFDLDIIDEDGKGTIPQVVLKIPNQNRIFQGYLESYEGAVEAVVLIRIISNSNKMENYSELELTFSVQSSSATSEAITFTLGTPNPFRRRFPQSRFIANHCNWQFKSIECAYAGTDSTCKRTLDDCKSKNNSVRFGGYPGLDRIGVRLV